VVPLARPLRLQLTAAAFLAGAVAGGIGASEARLMAHRRREGVNVEASVLRARIAKTRFTGRTIYACRADLRYTDQGGVERQAQWVRVPLYACEPARPGRTIKVRVQVCRLHPEEAWSEAPRYELAVLELGFAAVALGVGALVPWHAWRWRRRWRRAPVRRGVVEQVIERRILASEGRSLGDEVWRVLVRLSEPDGTTRTVASEDLRPEVAQRWQAGDPIDVRIDPARPDLLAIDDLTRARPWLGVPPPLAHVTPARVRVRARGARGRALAPADTMLPLAPASRRRWGRGEAG
jgi:hypothetical protein